MRTIKSTSFWVFFVLSASVVSSAIGIVLLYSRSMPTAINRAEICAKYDELTLSPEERDKRKAAAEDAAAKQWFVNFGGEQFAASCMNVRKGLIACNADKDLLKKMLESRFKDVIAYHHCNCSHQKVDFYFDLVDHKLTIKAMYSCCHGSSDRTYSQTF